MNINRQLITRQALREFAAKDQEENWQLLKGR
jgi:hypothetical protein